MFCTYSSFVTKEKGEGANITCPANDAAGLSYETPPPKQTSYGIAPWADARGSAGLQLLAAFF